MKSKFECEAIKVGYSPSNKISDLRGQTLYEVG
jgi:hypothetical protein